MSQFSLQIVLNNLEQCHHDEDCLLMDPYLAAFKELNKFFQGLGTVFNFISSDIASKIQIMDAYRADQHVADKYEDIFVMVEYERKTGALQNTSKPSGSRTVLRLNWALEFIAHFFKRLSTASENTKMSSLASESYQDTLAKHHPWYIRHGAGLALITLPTCKQMFSRALANEKEHLPQLLLSVSEAAQHVFDSTQHLYAEHNLLDLP
ncbi:ceramide-1-phosphate transfer protein-like [Ornithodoros turicata]|uniref:ceramide-1-phosphate transfer protein-like n=1 Tax=Ornithodoros turicata TaxID=34597 RepID=UPI00313A16C5